MRVKDGAEQSKKVMMMMMTVCLSQFVPFLSQADDPMASSVASAVASARMMGRSVVGSGRGGNGVTRVGARGWRDQQQQQQPLFLQLLVYCCVVMVAAVIVSLPHLTAASPATVPVSPSTGTSTIFT